ncbi:MAG: type 1 glutamine amidotransferase [Caldisericum sp.]
MHIKIVNLFPELLNLYGDKGNIIVLKKRAEWRNIKADIIDYHIEDTPYLLKEVDIVLLGGASDYEEKILFKFLLGIKNILKELIESNVPVLAICGGYQLLGNLYIKDSGEEIKGLGILDFYTKQEKGRLVGNLIIENNLGLFPKTVVGFENHGGRTYHNYNTFGKVLTGFGNNGKDKKEGIVYKNLIGTYMHGPILPKNPHIADYLIFNALKRKYGITFDEFAKLDDRIEMLAHRKVLALYNKIFFLKK